MKKKIISLLMILSTFFLIGNVNALEMSNDDIPAGSYVIGTHLFTREVTDTYDGTLTVQRIMFAAQTIGSFDINDMAIYYKNGSGVWKDTLTKETVTMPNKIDIEYKNTQSYTLNTPFLQYEVSPIVNGNYDLSLEIDKAKTGLVDGIEVYYAPIDSNNFEIIYNGSLTESTSTAGKKFYVKHLEDTKDKLYGNYKVKTYRLINNERIYSDFSNVITYKIPEAPILELVGTKKDNDDLVGTLRIENYVADKNTELRIYEYKNYEYFLNDEPNNNYRIDYNKQEIEVIVGAGDKYYYKAQIKKTYTGDLYYESGTKGEYSDESESVSIDNIDVEIPELSYEFVESKLSSNGTSISTYYDLTINNDSVPNGHWELFEVKEYHNGPQYTKVSSVNLGDAYRLRLVDEGTVQFVAQICQETGWNKNCNDYSNVIEFNEEIIKSDLLSEIELDITYPQDDFYKDGIYTFSYEIKNHDEIPSYAAWTLYEVKDGVKTKISTANIDEPNQFSIEAGKNKELAIGICFTKDNENLCDSLYAEIGNFDTDVFLDTLPELSMLDLESGTYNDDNLELKFILNNIEEYEMFSKYDNPRYLIQGWQLFELRDADTGTFVSVAEAEINAPEISLQIPYEEEKTFVATVYIEDTLGNRYYSDYSNELVVSTPEGPLVAPTITADGGYVAVNNQFEYYIRIDETGFYSNSDNWKKIDGIALYEKDGETYKFVEELTFEPLEGPFVELDFGSNKTYKLKVYREDSKDNKVYSDYSNELNIIIPQIGDVNADGLVAAADLIVLSQHVSGIELLSGDRLLAADVNQDGVVDYVDLQVMRMYFNNTIETLPHQTGTKYTITYNLDEGIVAYNPTEYISNATDITLENPTKEGYKFLGWTGSNGQKAQTDLIISNTTTGDLTYTANWISLEDIPEVPTIVSLYPSWTIEGVYEGVIGICDAGAYNGQNKPVGAELYVKTSSGYTLVDSVENDCLLYFELNPGETKVYTARVYINYDKDNKVYSNYSNEIIVKNENVITYDLDGGVNSVNNKFGYSSDNPNQRELEAPTKAGYTFLGWTGSNGDTPQLEVSIPLNTTGYLHYVANWELTDESAIDNTIPLAPTIERDTMYDVWTVTGQWNGQFDFCKTGAYNYQNKPSGAELYVKTSSGYTLVESVENDCWLYFELEPGESKVYTARVYNLDEDNNKVYSNYSNEIIIKNENVITYDLNGGVNSVNNKLGYSPYNPTARQLEAPTKDGYTFLGWTGSNGDTPQLQVTIPEGTTGNLEYTANWELVSQE